MMDSAYLDRITNDNQAVLLIENTQQNLLYPAFSLPTGSKPGTWFHVTIQENNITSIQIDIEKTMQMKSQIQNRLSRLQANQKSRFKKD